jgi:hypothetical protein
MARYADTFRGWRYGKALRTERERVGAPEDTRRPVPAFQVVPDLADAEPRALGSLQSTAIGRLRIAR